MKPVRWTMHAEQSLTERELDRREAELTLTSPEAVEDARPPRRVYQRRYADVSLGQEMLLRVIVEETATELVVVTAYKTSQFGKYLKGAAR